MNLADLGRLTKAVAGYLLFLLTSPELAYVMGEPFFWLLGMRRRGQKIDLSHIKRVLVVRLDEIGDVVMTTSFLRELRRNLPDAWITMVVKPAIYNLVEHCPYVNEVLTYDWHVSRYWRPLQRHWRALRLAHRHLWRRRFELAILPRWDEDNYHGTFVLYFSGAPWRVGYSEKVVDRKWRNNRGYDSLLTHPVHDPTLKHEVEHNLNLIRFLGGEVENDRLELWLGEEDEVFAEQLLRNHGAKSDDLLVVLAPGAGAPKRVWPIDRFVELGSWLQHEYGARLLVVGSPGEEPLGRELEQALGASVVNAVGRTTLRQAGALLQRCKIFVGNDAGPMHMAAAVGVSVVELSCHPRSGSPCSANSPLRFGPWGDDHIVIQPNAPQPPCVEECGADGPHCILGISVEEVKRAVEVKLEQTIYPRNPSETAGGG